ARVEHLPDLGATGANLRRAASGLCRAGASLSPSGAGGGGRLLGFGWSGSFFCHREETPSADRERKGTDEERMKEGAASSSAHDSPGIITVSNASVACL